MKSCPKSVRTLLAAFAAMGAIAATSFAQSVTTNPVGAFSMTLPRGSDTIVAVPFQNVATFTGAVSSASVSGTSLTLNVSSSPSWAANAYQGFYYVRFTSGVKNGMYYTVTSNTSGALTVNTAGDDVSGVVAGDTFKLFQHYTLNTLFPFNDATKNPLTASLNTLATGRRSQVIIPDNNFEGINLPAQGTYYFTSTGWIRAAAGNPVSNDVILYPDEFIIVRQPATVASDVTVVFTGEVSTNALALPLATRTAGTRDNALALTRPVDVTLAASGLAAGFVESLNTLATGRRDQLIVFDNTQIGFNKSAARTYYRFGGNWIRAAAGNPNANAEVLSAGSGFIVRKFQTANAAVSVAQNTPNY